MNIYLYKLRSLTLYPIILLRYQHDDIYLQKLMYIGNCILTIIFSCILFDIIQIIADYSIYIFIYSILFLIFLTPYNIYDLYRFLISLLICFVLYDIFLVIMNYIYIIKTVIILLILFFSIKEYYIMNI